MGWGNQSFAFICKQLNCKHETLKSYLKKMSIAYSGNRGGKGHKISRDYMPTLIYLKTAYPKSSLLRYKLIRDGIKQPKCEKCGNTHWLGEEISLELHHRDGDKFNNALVNLQILCPNCHSMEPNSNGKGKKKIKRAPVPQLAEGYGSGP